MWSQLKRPSKTVKVLKREKAPTDGKDALHLAAATCLAGEARLARARDDLPHQPQATPWPPIAA